MGFKLGIGNIDIRNVRPFNWAAFWAARFDSLCIKVVGDEMIDVSGNGNNLAITGKDFATDYIPGTSLATLNCPLNATFIADDTDKIWINANEESRDTEVSELIGYDFARTIVWYDDDSPYNIRAIGILKSAVTLTAAQVDKLHTDFKLPLFWSGVENVNGFVKGNRGLAQNIWTAVSVAALDYSDTYETAVLADGGVIVDRRIVETEYQRMIDTGNILSCWFSYHYQAGVKKSIVNYSGTDYDVVSKWYNMSPVAGRFAASVTAYQDATYDTRAEFTESGLRFRTTALNGTDRCGFDSPSAIPTNNNNIIGMRIVCVPIALNDKSFIYQGSAAASGVIGIGEASGVNVKHLKYKHSTAIAIINAVSQNSVIDYGVEIEIETLANYTTKVLTAEINGVAKTMLFFDAGAIYPSGNFPDLIGHERTTGRDPANVYIKQVDLYTL